MKILNTAHCHTLAKNQRIFKYLVPLNTAIFFHRTLLSACNATFTIVVTKSLKLSYTPTKIHMVCKPWLFPNRFLIEVNRVFIDL